MQSVVQPGDGPISCEKCGTALTMPAFGGLCPRCLMAEGVAAAPVSTGDTARISKGFFIRNLGDYELLEEVARGGMGVIYKARQRSLGRLVAVKVLSAGEFASREYVERFRTEAAAAARLQHPNIVTIHEVGTQDGIEYFSMDYVEGANLAELVKEHPLPPERAAGCLKSLAEAVQYAHLRGILHRDLKPSNVLVDPFGEPRITDFGLAKELTGKSDLTATGQVLGTPGYMPPEQADAEFGAVGPQSDVYSLGAVLYFMLTGRPPFAAGSLHQTLRLVLTTEPVPVRMLNPSVPRDLETICLKCLEKEPANRYASAAELVSELEHFLAGRAIKARPISLPEVVFRWCRRQPALATLGAVVLLLLLALAFGATAAAVRIAAARDAQARERTRAERMVNQLEAQEGDNLLRDGQVSPALAHLASVLRKEPDNRTVAARIVSVLMERSFPLPICPPIPHGTPVGLVMFSPDGKRIATASSDGVVGIWDADTGRASVPLMSHAGKVVLVKFSPDGRRLYTASADKTARVWDTESGLEALPALVHSAPITMAELTIDGRKLITVADGKLRMWDAGSGQATPTVIDVYGYAFCIDISADGRRVVMGGRTGVARVWDLESGALVVELPAKQGWLQSVRFSPTGDRVVTSSYDKHSAVWELATARKLCEVRATDVIHDAAFSPDGRRFATVGRDYTARIFDAQTGEPLSPPMEHKTVVTRVGFSPDGQRLLTIGWDNTAWVWDATNGRLYSEPIQHDNRILSAEFSPDGRRIATASEDRTAMIWDVRPGNNLPLTFRHAQSTGVAFNPNGTRLLTWAADGTARVWDPQTGDAVTPILNHRARIVMASLSPDSTRVVTAAMDSKAGIWDATNGRRLLTLGGHSNVVEFAEFSPDGATVLTASRDATAAIWDAKTGERRTTFKHGGRIWMARFSPNGRRVVTCSDDGTARVWSAATGQPVGAPLQHDGAVYSASFSADGQRVVTASFDMTARVWETATGHPVTRALKHYANLRWAEFSHDGTKVVTASADHTACIWDALSGRRLVEPLQHHGEVWRATFSMDDQLVATVSHDGTARVWNTLTAQPVTEPLTHGDWFASASLSWNNRWLAAGQNSGGAFIWEVPEVNADPPAWLPALAEAVACRKVTAEGYDFVSPAKLVGIRNEHRNGRTVDSWERFIRWFFADRDLRTISPSSSITVNKMIERLGGENTYESLREALHLKPHLYSLRMRLAILAVHEELEGKAPVDFHRRWAVTMPEAELERALHWETTNAPAAREIIHRLEDHFATNAHFYYIKGRNASRLERTEEACASFERALALVRPAKEQLLQTVCAVGWRNLLLRLDRREAALTNQLVPLKIAARDAQLGRAQIDLTRVYNAAPDEPWHDYSKPDNSLAKLPRGAVTLDGVLYDVRGLLQLHGNELPPYAPGYPAKIMGIPIGQACRRLHFLQGTGWGDNVKPGTEIGYYRVRYTDGSVETIPICTGEDLLEWLNPGGKPASATRADTAWQGVTPRGTKARLFHRAWDNPHPGREVAAIDFCSTQTAAAPFLVALTVE
jgi:WD40 repeat protein